MWRSSGEVVGQPERRRRGIPGEHDDAAACDTSQLGKPKRLVRPVVHGQDRERGVEAVVLERQCHGGWPGQQERTPTGRWAIIVVDSSTATTARSAGSYAPVPAPTLTTEGASPRPRAIVLAKRGSALRTSA